MARKKKEDCDLFTVFSKRVGTVICPDGSKLEFEKSLEVTKETLDWLLKSFPKDILKID